MKIRPAKASDYDQLCELFDEVDVLHREARPDIFRKPDGPPRSIEHVSGLIGGPASAILVAEHGGVLSGLAVVVEQPRSANPLHVPRRVVEIVTIVVRNSARRRGIGKSLIDASLIWAKERGADHVEISVHAFNEEAIRAYAAAGFQMSIHRLVLRSPFRDGEDRPPDGA
jgi:ribosomal protein S18 acetylase RimI-like enzyme